MTAYIVPLKTVPKHTNKVQDRHVFGYEGVGEVAENSLCWTMAGSLPIRNRFHTSWPTFYGCAVVIESSSLSLDWNSPGIYRFPPWNVTHRSLNKRYPTVVQTYLWWFHTMDCPWKLTVWMSTPPPIKCHRTLLFTQTSRSGKFPNEKPFILCILLLSMKSGSEVSTPCESQQYLFTLSCRYQLLFSSTTLKYKINSCRIYCLRSTFPENAFDKVH